MVSIPNGMEFYVVIVFFAVIKQGFNSQRDGILLFFRFCGPACHSSFNSQRDGILRFISSVSSTFDLVSIPNGMEFYARAHSIASSAFMFQFPTGWNSTLSKVSIWISSATSFNSQRDGILQHEFCHFSR